MYYELRTNEQQIDLYSVGMEYPEALKAEQYIKGKNKMLEWGCGGSTLYFPKLVKNYVSIEHNQEWYEKLKPQLLDNVEFYHVPIHEEKFDDDLDKNAADILSGPEDTEVRDNIVYWTTRGRFDWHRGLDYIKKPMELSYRNYDVILVDGRCRAMCAYMAKYLLKDNGHLLFHDFNNRTYYHGILKYYEIVDSTETLAVLVKK
jgi:hypothetical protein